MLLKKLEESRSNHFGSENYDEFRFGAYPKNSHGYFNQLKSLLKRVILSRQINIVHGAGLQFLYDRLDAASRQLLVELIAYRILGHQKVKLSRNDKEWREALEAARALAVPGDTYNPHFLHFILEKFDLSKAGYDLRLYLSAPGIAIVYLLEQYACKRGRERVVAVEPGDTVLDAGGCWADSALYFAHWAGAAGKVYSFEFVPGNITLFERNLSFNPDLAKRIQLTKQPISNVSNQTVYFSDKGPASVVRPKPFSGQAGSAPTITIDDFVQRQGLSRVDFIKMDIEGAETPALEGSIETIRKHRPKLAVATYHSLHDLVTIPKWILDLDLDYEIFLGHYTIHAEETICFARPKTQSTQ